MIHPSEILLRRRGFVLVDKFSEPASYTQYTNISNVSVLVIGDKHSVGINFHVGYFISVECNTKEEAKEFYTRLTDAIENM